MAEVDRSLLVQQVKQANDIVDVVGSKIPLRPAGPTFKGLCPFHEDKNPSFDVDPRRQRYKCWACAETGDVIRFIEKIDGVTFREALETLAQRAGISLEKPSFAKHGPSRARMLDVVRWAMEQFHQCLLDAPEAEAARLYLGERKLRGDTVRRFMLGFAPPSWDWLVGQAKAAGQPLDIVEQVGLIAKRKQGNGHYDRFRDRVIFPIRDVRGQAVGFGGRILPSSSLSAEGPKYYNSAETNLFSKSEQLYGIDQARQAANEAGYLAVVEGYTDVLMAHQMGIRQVVATMGTALNERHVKKLRSLVPRVVLVFDADAGGDKGVDRALEVFVRQDMDLRVARLPAGLDPCDLLVKEGAEPFRRALEGAVDVFEHKLHQIWTLAENGGVDARHKALEHMLGLLALTSELRTLKMELMVNRIAHRFSLKEEKVWQRLRELHARRQEAAPEATPLAVHSTARAPAQPLPPSAAGPAAPVPRAKKFEVELIEVLLADATLVAQAQAALPANQVEHPEIRRLVEGLYALLAEGLPADLDQLRSRLDNESLLLNKAFDAQRRGQEIPDRRGRLQSVLARFRERENSRQFKELDDKLRSASDHHTARTLLMRAQLIDPESNGTAADPPRSPAHPDGQDDSDSR